MLLAEPGIENYDVIALQEPVRNSQTEGTLCPRSCAFYPVYQHGLGQALRVVALVNKRIPVGD